MSGGGGPCEKRSTPANVWAAADAILFTGLEGQTDRLIERGGSASDIERQAFGYRSPWDLCGSDWIVDIQYLKGNGGSNEELRVNWRGWVYRASTHESDSGNW